MSDCHGQQTTVVFAEEVQLTVASLESSQPQQLWGQTWSPASPQLPHWQSSAGVGVQVIPWRVAVAEPSVAVVSVAAVVTTVAAVSTASAVGTVGFVAASCYPAASVGSSSASLAQLLQYQET